MRWLLANGLLDELALLVHPIAVGSGQRLFEDTPTIPLTLVHSRGAGQRRAAPAVRPGGRLSTARLGLTDPRAAEGVAVGPRRRADPGEELTAQRLGRAEPDGVRDPAHREVGVLEQGTGPLDPAAGDPAGQALADLGAEPAHQGPLAHVRVRGDLAAA